MFLFSSLFLVLDRSMETRWEAAWCQDPQEQSREVSYTFIVLDSLPPCAPLTVSFTFTTAVPSLNLISPSPTTTYDHICAKIRDPVRPPLVKRVRAIIAIS